MKAFALSLLVFCAGSFAFGANIPANIAEECASQTCFAAGECAAQKLIELETSEQVRARAVSSVEFGFDDSDSLQVIQVRSSNCASSSCSSKMTIRTQRAAPGELCAAVYIKD